MAGCPEVQLMESRQERADSTKLSLHLHMCCNMHALPILNMHAHTISYLNILNMRFLELVFLVLWDLFPAVTFDFPKLKKETRGEERRGMDK